MSSTALRSSATGLPGRVLASFDNKPNRLLNSLSGMYLGKPTLCKRTASVIWLPRICGFQLLLLFFLNQTPIVDVVLVNKLPENVVMAH